jgi:hypothetical protein
MPWELQARNRDGSPLGDLVEVRRALAEVFPGVDFYRRPSGSVVLRRLEGETASADQVESFARIPAAFCGVFEGEGVSVEFLLGSEEIVGSVALDVRGDTQAAMPLLESLAFVTGWRIDQLGFGGYELYFE